MRAYDRKVIKGIIYKRCSRCKEYKPLTAFYPDRENIFDGRQRYCISCIKEYIANKEYLHDKHNK